MFSTHAPPFPGFFANIPPSWSERYGSSVSSGVRRPPIREKLEQVLDPKGRYVFVTTTANPAATKELETYVGIRKNSEDDPWEIRKKRVGDHPVYCPGAQDECNGLWFKPGLMEEYLECIQHQMKRWGKNQYTSYPLAPTEGVHFVDMPKGSIFWPVVHVVREEKERELRSIVDHLNGSESLTYLRRRQAPQNYLLGEIETLSRLRISPVVIGEKEWRMDGKTLTDIIEWLLPLTLVSTSRDPSIDVD